MNRISAMVAALQHGASLADPAIWKRRQLAVNAVTGLLGAGVALAASYGTQIPLGEAELAALAGGVVAVAGAVNSYFTTATTEKIGLGPSKPRPAAGDPDR